MSTKNNNPFENKLKSIEALLLSQEKGAEDSLKILGDSSDPDSIRTKLFILLRADRIEDAVAIVKGRPPNERWCDRAISAYVRNNDIASAKLLLDWTKGVDDEILRNRCRLFYSDARYINALRNRKIGEAILPSTLTDEEKVELVDALDTLEPIIAKVIAEENIYNEIESQALQLAIQIFYLFSNAQKVANLANLLLKRKPIPIEACRLALNRLIKIPTNIPERLRTEHPESFEAKLLACMLESVVFGEHSKAYSCIKSLVYLAENESQKLNFCKALYQIAQYLDDNILEEAKDICISCISNKHPFVFLIQSSLAIRKKDFENAQRYLLNCKDENDPNWLQAYANYLLCNHNPQDALIYLNKARSILPHTELLKTTAHVAFQTEDYDLSIDILKEALQSEPENITLLNNLSISYFKKGDYQNAAIQFEKLKSIDPSEMSYFLNLASCYTQLGRPEKAIQVYDEICKRDDAPLEAFLAKAYLEKINDPKKAFSTILPLKDKYWENPQYLQAVLDLSYKAGEEDYSHQALLKLRELQHKGKAPQEILQIKTIEDIKVYANQWNEKVKIINQNVLTGIFPWLMADHWQNHTSYMGWYIRIQPLTWHIEEPMTCASLSIYSTNSFKKVKQPDETTRLDFIECPSKDADIVIDLSALITLHQLNILEKSIEYFNNVYIPKEYSVRILKDCDDLVIHQLTRKSSAEAIKKAIDDGQIAIVKDIGTPGERPLPFVNEHTLSDKEEEYYYRLIDILNIAYGAGKIDEGRYNNLKKIAHKPSSTDSDHPELKYGQSILVDLHTLQSICQVDAEALSPIIDAFKVFISIQDQIRNSNEITHISIQETIKSLNNELLQIIRDDNKFTKQGHTHDTRLEQDDVFFASWELAKDKSLPLLVDDRVSQVLAINANNSVEYPAFGTDRLLLKLFENDLIDIDALSDAFLKLMNWRYRFIVPTKEILLNLAKRYKDHPPGKDLQNVALYLHDCMRDPGLFGGQENTTLKESMGIKLFVSWIRLISEFLACVWADSEFNKENAKTLTEWSINEFVPSLPKCLIHTHLEMTENMPIVLFDYFLARASVFENTSRANTALQVLAECLNMGEIEYFKAVSEVVDIYGKY